MPNYRALYGGGIDALEEERRIMYVAMTRAKDNLYMTDSGGYNSITNDIKKTSRFITESQIYEIDKESMPIEIITKSSVLKTQTNKENTNYDMESIVIHPVFGEGKIMEITDDGFYYIEFNEFGQKAISINFTRLKLVR